ncbi:MAG: M56 family metallopeptidase, partial [Verrucomicrobiota bacterium]
MVVLITRLWKNPHLARLLWFLVLMKLVTPPLIDLPLPMFPVSGELVEFSPSSNTRPGGSQSVTNIFDEDAPAGATRAPADTSGAEGWALIIWLTGFTLLALLGFRRHRRVVEIIRQSSPAKPQIQAEAQRLSEKLGLSDCPKIRISSQRVPPFVTAHPVNQVVVLPSSLLSELSADQRQTVLAHELAHLRWGDRWLRLIELLVLAVNWWNPVAWLASRRLRQAMEACCDAVVVWAMPASRKSYGEALFRTVEFLTKSEPMRPLTANTLGSSGLKNRIEDIMSKETNHRPSHPVLAFVLVLGVIILPTTIVVSQESPDVEGNRPSAVPVESRPDSVAAVRWEVMNFELVDGDSDEVERKVAEIVRKNITANLSEIGASLDKHGLKRYSTSRKSHKRVPAFVSGRVAGLNLGHTAAPVRSGQRYTLVRKS